MKIGYVVNTYPAPSQSFIRREIQALERRGLTIRRFAMRPYDGALVDAGDRAEAERTEYALAQGASGLAGALLRAALLRPRRFAAAAATAWRAARGVASGRWRHAVYLAEAAWLAERARDFGLDRLHAHFGTNSAAVAMLARALGGPPFSFTVHGPEEFDRPESIALGLKLEQADFAVAVSSYGRSQLCRWVDHGCWPKLITTPCGVEARLYGDAPPPPETPPLRLVSVGRFAEQKGQLLLVEALAEATRRGVDWRLDLVGDGPMRPAIEAAISRHDLQDRIVLTGWLDEDGVRAAVGRAHALVLPSFAEGLPLALIEAMAAARPVVATWIAGIPELVRHGEAGWLVPAGDAQALGEAICELSRTPPARLAEMGRRGRARALDRHDVDKAAETLAARFAQPPRARPG